MRWGYFLLVVAIVATVFLSGCDAVTVEGVLENISEANISRIAEDVIVCNDPYIRHADGCCLDRNYNGMCDVDENAALEQPAVNDTVDVPVVNDTVDVPVVNDTVDVPVVNDTVDVPVVNDTVDVPVVPVCGNGVVEDGEQCDGVDLVGSTCMSLGFDAGDLSCSACAFNISACTNASVCADDACGGDCGDCDAGYSCVDSVCVEDSVGEGGCTPGFSPVFTDTNGVHDHWVEAMVEDGEDSSSSFQSLELEILANDNGVPECIGALELSPWGFFFGHPCSAELEESVYVPVGTPVRFRAVHDDGRLAYSEMFGYDEDVEVASAPCS